MQYEENMCCDCVVPGYPCSGDLCPLRHVVMYKCDRCGKDELTEDEITHYDDMDLCDDCCAEIDDEDKE